MSTFIDDSANLSLNNKYLLYSVKNNICTNGCRGYLEMVQLFIDKGADLNAVDKNGRTVLDVILQTGDKYEGTFKRSFRLQK